MSLVARPGDQAAFHAAAGSTALRLDLIPQPASFGYGHAIKCVRQLVADAEVENCAVSADCESLLRRLGYTAKVEITAA